MSRGGFGIGVEVVMKTADRAGLSGGESGLGDTLRAFMEKAGRAAAEQAKRLAPVKTGRLRDSIAWTVSAAPDGSLEAAVGTDVPYAAVQELGTVRVRGKHYLENGLAAGAAEAFGRA